MAYGCGKIKPATINAIHAVIGRNASPPSHNTDKQAREMAEPQVSRTAFMIWKAKLSCRGSGLHEQLCRVPYFTPQSTSAGSDVPPRRPTHNDDSLGRSSAECHTSLRRTSLAQPARIHCTLRFRYTPPLLLRRMAGGGVETRVTSV